MLFPNFSKNKRKKELKKWATWKKKGMNIEEERRKKRTNKV